MLLLLIWNKIKAVMLVSILTESKVNGFTLKVEMIEKASGGQGQTSLDLGSQKL